MEKEVRAPMELLPAPQSLCPLSPAHHLEFPFINIQSPFPSGQDQTGSRPSRTG